MHLLSDDIIIPVVPKIEDTKLSGLLGIQLSLVIPKGTAALDVNSLRFKDRCRMSCCSSDTAKLDAKYKDLLDASQLQR